MNCAKLFDIHARNSISQTEVEHPISKAPFLMAEGFLDFEKWP
jgi:hypothetical protein